MIDRPPGNPAGQRGKRCVIALCANQAYFPPAYVVCLALATSLAGRHDVILFTEQSPLLDRVPADLPFRIETPDFLARLPDLPEVIEGKTAFTFLRFFLPDLLTDYDRMLYLDCDIRVAGPVSDIFDLDLKGAPFAAVDDLITTLFPVDVPDRMLHHQALGLAADDYYCNAGVLLIDCEKWRREHFTDLALNCMNRLGRAAKHHDQDVLNVAFRNKWLALSPRWNFVVPPLWTDVRDIIQPVIHHHLLEKPWHGVKFAHWSERKHFLKAIKGTPFEDFVGRATYRQVKRSFEWRIKRLIESGTPFLPASRKRRRARMRLEKHLADYLVKNIEARRFADVEQGFSHINVPTLKSFLLQAG